MGRTSRNLPPSATAFPFISGTRRDISRALSPCALGKKSVKEQLSWELRLCRINTSVEYFPRWMTQSPLVSETSSASRDLALPGSQSKILRDPDLTPSHSSHLRLLMNVSVDNDRSKQHWFEQYIICTWGAGGSEVILQEKWVIKGFMIKILSNYSQPRVQSGPSFGWGILPNTFFLS